MRLLLLTLLQFILRYQSLLLQKSLKLTCTLTLSLLTLCLLTLLLLLHLLHLLLRDWYSMSNHDLLLLTIVHDHHWPHHPWLLLRLLRLLLHMTDRYLRKVGSLASLHRPRHHHLSIRTSNHGRLSLIHDCHPLLLLHLHSLIWSKLRSSLDDLSCRIRTWRSQ